MKIWLLEANREKRRVTYDCVHAFVIQARSLRNARKMASESASDEGSAWWLDPKTSTCTHIGSTCLSTQEVEKVILRDFRAG